MPNIPRLRRELVHALDYPFDAHYLEVEGGRMHYVDEGTGAAIVLVHGTPTWSYLYRRLIAGLSDRYRVIAPDLLGFGKSDKSSEADYRPAVQAQRLAALLDHLDLQDVVLGVHDFGGPIGLSYAIERPEKVRALVLFNTWMWSLAGTPAGRASRMMSGALGRFLYTRLNFSPRVLLKAAFGDKSKLTKPLHRRYLEPFGSRSERMAPWVYARELLGSTEWYESLWSRRDRIASKPALVLWGMNDPAFRPESLERWRNALKNARFVEFADAGHFVQEEAPKRAEREISAFLCLESCPVTDAELRNSSEARHT